jgi:hypothetical protein
MERHKGATRRIGEGCIEQIKFYGNLLPLAAYRHSAPEKKGIVLAFMPEHAVMLLRESNPVRMSAIRRSSQSANPRGSTNNQYEKSDPENAKTSHPDYQLD